MNGAKRVDGMAATGTPARYAHRLTDERPYLQGDTEDGEEDEGDVDHAAPPGTLLRESALRELDAFGEPLRHKACA